MFKIGLLVNGIILLILLYYIYYITLNIIKIKKRVFILNEKIINISNKLKINK